MDEIVRELLNLLKEVSPAVYESLYKQAFVDGFNYVLWSVVFLVAASVCLYWFRKGMNKWGWEEEAMFFLGLGFVLSFVMFVLLSTAGVSRFVNPDFYVIRFLIRSIK